jgi:Bacterial archaeo-eukaryotic release factor family 10
MRTAIRQDTRHMLAVVLDRAHARFFDVDDAGAMELPTLESPARRGGKFHSDPQDSPGWGEREHHGWVREEARRYLAAIVERLVRLDRERSGVGLLVAGPPPSIAALWRVLPPDLGDRVVGTTRLNPTEATPAIVARAARHACETRGPAAERDSLDLSEEDRLERSLKPVTRSA